jgi:hypothetical protein
MKFNMDFYNHNMDFKFKAKKPCHLAGFFFWKAINAPASRRLPQRYSR